VNTHPSNYQLDRWRLGLLSPLEAAAVAGHFASCSTCRLAQEEQERAYRDACGDREYLARSILDRARRTPTLELVSSTLPPAPVLRLPPRKIFPVLAALAAAIAALVLFAPPPAELIRFKGESPELVVFRDRDGTVARASEGIILSPGDRLRFQIHLPRARPHAMIVGIETSGQLFAYPPFKERSAEYAEETLLPGSAELDASWGRETIVLIACPGPFQLRELAREGAEQTLRAPEDCRTSALSITKEHR
jgi:hypothetical protein